MKKWETIAHGILQVVQTEGAVSTTSSILIEKTREYIDFPYFTSGQNRSTVVNKIVQRMVQQKLVRLHQGRIYTEDMYLRECHESRNIPGLPGFRATRCGMIINAKKEWREVPAWHNKKGYRRVRLYSQGMNHNYRVARLVCLAWHGKPHMLETVDHINSIRDDDRAENLRWLDHVKNIRRQYNE